jgi:chemotaxis protein histidine kinase CheA
VGRFTLSIPTLGVESISRNKRHASEEPDFVCDLRKLFSVGSESEVAHIINLKSPLKKSSPNRRNGVFRLIVDDIIGNKRLMVMPIGELLAKTGFFSGVGIMENGDLSVLLSVESLLQIAK